MSYPTQLAVRCDAPGCAATFSGDFLVADDDPRDTRLGYVLDHVVALGWRVLGRDLPQVATTYCAAHREAAVAMCGHCGELDGGDGTQVAYHDFPRPARAVCPGARRPARDARRDGRLLGNGRPNPHLG